MLFRSKTPETQGKKLEAGKQVTLGHQNLKEVVAETVVTPTEERPIVRAEVQPGQCGEQQQVKLHPRTEASLLSDHECQGVAERGRSHPVEELRTNHLKLGAKPHEELKDAEVVTNLSNG